MTKLTLVFTLRKNVSEQGNGVRTRDHRCRRGLLHQPLLPGRSAVVVRLFQE